MKKSQISTASLLYAVLSLAFLFGNACTGGSQKKVYFGNLQEGAQVESPFKVEMKAENLVVEPATAGVTEGRGHFHIIVDAPLASPSEPMAKDEKHIHYGQGESEALLDLAPGPHSLILQFAKGDHVPYDPLVYQQVQITVTGRKAAAESPKAAAPDTAKTARPDSAKSAE